MKLTTAFLTLFAIAPASAAEPQFGEVPPGLSTDGSKKSWTDFVEAVFPTWCIDGEEKRIEDAGETCEDGTKNGRWDPLYLTKWHGGKDPALGGYPTDVDTRYPFYYASGFFGQACAGGNSHCSFDFDGGKHNCAKCGKIVTDHDDGPNGPGHVPPHIGLASLTRAYNTGEFGDVATWFDYEQNACRVMPNILLPMIRKYFPRNEDGTNSYPPPFTNNGGPASPDGSSYPYPLEYVNLVGESCTEHQAKFDNVQCYEQHSGTADEYPEYLLPGHGSPHYCSEGAKAADVNNDWCPYVFFGDNRGKYRHPHIAYAAVEVWLANQVMPDKCGATWDDNDGKDYPFMPNDNSVAFPMMAAVKDYPEDPMQPDLTDEGAFIWPGDEGTKRKAVPGNFVIEKYLTPTTIGEPVMADDMDGSGGGEGTGSSDADSSEGGEQTGEDGGDGMAEDGGDGTSEDTGDGTAEDGGEDLPASRSLKRDSTEYSHQVTLTIGGLIMAVGGFLLSY